MTVTHCLHSHCKVVMDMEIHQVVVVDNLYHTMVLTGIGVIGVYLARSLVDIYSTPAFYTFPLSAHLESQCCKYMASSRRLKKLDCFYCGTKSDVFQNGSKQHFECKHCLSTNYVDQVCHFSNHIQQIANSSRMEMLWIRPRTSSR